jgi:5-methyltetrahydrofolate--homocysteine methyltransferase
MMDEQLHAICQAVTNGEDDDAVRLVTEAIEVGLPPLEILQNGVIAGITQAGKLWNANEFFLPDVIMAAESFKAAMTILEPRLQGTEGIYLGKKFVIGVVQGDVHDLGKNLVVNMLTSAGFDVIDLGINVPLERFIEVTKEKMPDILGIGAYMTTTMLSMREVIDELEQQGLRDDMKIMVGGVPTSQDFADEIGADAWGKDALDALQKARLLVGDF